MYLIRVRVLSFLKMLSFVGLLAGCGGCGGGGGAAPPPSATSPPPLTLNVFAGPEAMLTLISASGSAPYTGQVYGTCGKLQDSTTSFIFAFTGTAGGCVLTVADLSGQVQAVRLLISPPRVSLVLDPGYTDISLAIGTTQAFAVSEILGGRPFARPYSAIVQGTCAGVSRSGQTVLADTFTVTSTNVGRCVVVFGDALGQATAVNLSVAGSATGGVPVSH